MIFDTNPVLPDPPTDFDASCRVLIHEHMSYSNFLSWTSADVMSWRLSRIILHAATLIASVLLPLPVAFTRVPTQSLHCRIDKSIFYQYSILSQQLSPTTHVCHVHRRTARHFRMAQQSAHHADELAIHPFHPAKGARLAIAHGTGAYRSLQHAFREHVHEGRYWSSCRTGSR